MRINTPITLTNSQSGSTPALFQQMIQAPILFRNGVRFWSPTDGQLYAWLESISNGTATIWVRIPSSIPANGTYQLYMIQDSTLPMDGVYWGEAPQLSSSYAQYDNGASIFPLYDNFAGTSVPSGWTVSGTVTINNGLAISGSSLSSQIATTSTYGTSILDWYGYAAIPTASGAWVNLGWYFNINTSQGNNWFTHDGQSDYGYGYVTSSTTPTITYTSTPAGSSPNYVFSVANDGTNAHYYLNYAIESTTYAMQGATNYIAFRNGSGSSSGGGANVFVQWVRVRDYPPNGVMPTVSLGASQYSGMLIQLR